MKTKPPEKTQNEKALRMSSSKALLRDSAIDAAILSLGFEEVAERGVDRLDFREIQVAVLRRALERVYEAGAASAAQSATSNTRRKGR